MAIQGEIKMPVELQYGDFGCADPEVEKRTGQTNYNVKILMWITKDTTGEVIVSPYYSYKPHDLIPSDPTSEHFPGRGL